MRSYWRRNGPPLVVAVHRLGRELGIDWTAGMAVEEAESAAVADAGPSIAELALTLKPLTV